MSHYSYSLSAQTFVGESHSEVNWNLVFFHLGSPGCPPLTLFTLTLSLHATLLRPVASYSQLESFLVFFGSVCNFGITKKYRILSNEVDGGRIPVREAADVIV